MNQLQQQTKHYESIKKAIEYLDDNYSYQPTLDEVASHVSMSKHHFSRVFKEYVGVTPMQFLSATTLAYAKEKLHCSKSILETTLDVGLSSSSRLHDLFVNFTAMTPNEYKHMGEDIVISYGVGFSPFGKSFIAHTNKGVCALEFYDESYNELVDKITKSWSRARFVQDNDKAQELLNSIFIHKDDLTLLVKGTNFQISVWKALLNIHSAELSTYSDIATYVGKPKAVRAVATAIGSNPIGFLIPCHRVISKSAAFAGYRWGITRKRVILAYEQSKE